MRTHSVSGLFVLFFASCMTLISLGGYQEALGCVKIKDPVAFDFNRAQAVTNDWYTPDTSYFFWRDLSCNTTVYIDESTEHQYYLKKGQVAKYGNQDKSTWSKLVNHYKLHKTKPGVSYWWAVYEFAGFELPIPLTTKSYAVYVDPTYTVWGAYYCSKDDFGLISEGFDIRSAYLPLERETVANIVKIAREKGVPEYLLAKLYSAPYDGCTVNSKADIFSRLSPPAPTAASAAK